MEAIGAVVDNLDDLDAKLTPMLLALGEQHSKTRGFGIQFFEVFTQCLILVWEERLGDQFTPDVRAAWEKLFVFMLMTLREGYGHVRAYSEESIEQDPNTTSYDEDENMENGFEYTCTRT
jgi:hemoglobin-like flavoprotein